MSPLGSSIIISGSGTGSRYGEGFEGDLVFPLVASKFAGNERIFIRSSNKEMMNCDLLDLGCVVRRYNVSFFSEFVFIRFRSSLTLINMIKTKYIYSKISLV